MLCFDPFSIISLKHSFSDMYGMLLTSKVGIWSIRIEMCVRRREWKCVLGTTLVFSTSLCWDAVASSCQLGFLPRYVSMIAISNHTHINTHMCVCLMQIFVCIIYIYMINKYIYIYIYIYIFACARSLFSVAQVYVLCLISPDFPRSTRWPIAALARFEPWDFQRPQKHHRWGDRNHG